MDDEAFLDALFLFPAIIVQEGWVVCNEVEKERLNDERLLEKKNELWRENCERVVRKATNEVLLFTRRRKVNGFLPKISGND